MISLRIVFLGFIFDFPAANPQIRSRRADKYFDHFLGLDPEPTVDQAVRILSLPGLASSIYPEHLLAALDRLAETPDDVRKLVAVLPEVQRRSGYFLSQLEPVRERHPEWQRPSRLDAFTGYLQSLLRSCNIMN